MKRTYSGVQPAPAKAAPPLRHSTKRFSGVALDGIVLGGILLAAYIASLLPFMRLTTIHVDGQEKLNPAYVVDQTQKFLTRRRTLIFPQSSYVYADTNGLAGELTGQLRKILPIEQVEVRKRWPNSLYITVQEQAPLANFTDDTSTYLVDRDGRLTVAPARDESIPTINDTTSLRFTAGEVMLNATMVGSLAEITRLLDARSLGPVSFETPELECPFDLTSPTPQIERETENTNTALENSNGNTNSKTTGENPLPTPQPLTRTDCDLNALLRDSKEVLVKTGDGWSIRLSTAQPAGETLGELFKALNSNLKGVPLQTVDLRFLPRIIYR